jgi:hypothetical protein
LLREGSIKKRKKYVTIVTRLRERHHLLVPCGGLEIK